MNVITLWINDEGWDRAVMAAFVNDISAWLVAADLGNVEDAPLRSVVTAAEVELGDISREEFVSLVAGGQGIVVVPKSEGEHEAYLPPEGEPDVPEEAPTKIEGQTELDDYARGYQDGYEAGLRDGSEQAMAEAEEASQPKE